MLEISYVMVHKNLPEKIKKIFLAPLDIRQECLYII